MIVLAMFDDGRRDEKRSCELALVDSSCFRRSCVTPTCFATFAEKSADLFRDGTCIPSTCRERGPSRLPFGTRNPGLGKIYHDC